MLAAQAIRSTALHASLRSVADRFSPSLDILTSQTRPAARSAQPEFRPPSELAPSLWRAAEFRVPSEFL